MEPARRFSKPMERHELDAELDAVRAAIEHLHQTLMDETERTHIKLADLRAQMERMEAIIAAAASALNTLSWRPPAE